MVLVPVDVPEVKKPRCLLLIFVLFPVGTVSLTVYSPVPLGRLLFFGVDQKGSTRGPKCVALKNLKIAPHRSHTHGQTENNFRRFRSRFLTASSARNCRYQLTVDIVVLRVHALSDQ